MRLWLWNRQKDREKQAQPGLSALNVPKAQISTMESEEIRSKVGCQNRGLTGMEIDRLLPPRDSATVHANSVIAPTTMRTIWTDNLYVLVC
jgi:hypothetical protein